MLKNRKRRLLLDALVALSAIVFTVYFLAIWIRYDFPVYGMHDGLFGYRNYFFPWLFEAVVSFTVAIVASIDFYIYLNTTSDTDKKLK